jgi:hypothetical protein
VIPKLVKSGVVASIVATLASSLAAWLYGIADFDSFSPWIITYAPIWQSALVAFPMGLALAFVFHKSNTAVFASVATVIAGISGYLLGEFVVGRSPHFSHDRAVVFLTATWAFCGLTASIAAVFASNNSLERTRAG